MVVVIKVYKNTKMNNYETLQENNSMRSYHVTKSNKNMPMDAENYSSYIIIG